MWVPSCPFTDCGAERNTAKKEDNPEQALKEFRAIVDKEEEKGDWYVVHVVVTSTGPSYYVSGGSRR